MNRLPLVLPGLPYDQAAVTVATSLESGRVSGDCGSSNAALLTWRETEEFGDFQDLNFILSNSLSHQESVAAMVSSSASSLSPPMSSSSARVPSTCIFSYPIRTSMAPGSSSGSLLYGGESAPPPTLPSTWQTSMK